MGRMLEENNCMICWRWGQRERGRDIFAACYRDAEVTRGLDSEKKRASEDLQ